MELHIPNFRAYDWDLYTRKSGAEVIAQRLNEQFAHLMRKYAKRELSREAVRHHMREAMRKPEYAEFGSTDTEPMEFAMRVVERACNAIDTLTNYGML